MTMIWRSLDTETYRNKVEAMVLGGESNVPVVYLDIYGIPTVGAGKAVIVESKGKWIIDDKSLSILEDIRGKPLTAEQMKKIESARDTLDKYGRGSQSLKTNAGDFYIQYPRTQTERTDPKNNNFGLILSGAELKKLKDAVIHQTERDFDLRMRNAKQEPLKEKVPFSEERVALISIYHQCPACVGKETRAALNKGDRAEVIYQIENKMDQTFKTRRKREADQFGRPDDPAIVRYENDSQQAIKNVFNKAGEEEKKKIRGIPTGKYIWRTVGDDKVRAEHAAREGLVFEWANPPSDGNPGEAYGCRCWAEDLIDEGLGVIFKK